MICYEGKVALCSFLLSSSFLCLIFLPNVIYGMVPNLQGAIFWGPLMYFIFINIILKILFKFNNYQVLIEIKRKFMFVLKHIFVDCHTSRVSRFHFFVRNLHLVSRKKFDQSVWALYVSVIKFPF